MGAAEAGLYRAAERIVASFAELLSEPARMLGWGAFGKAVSDDGLGGTLQTRLSEVGAGFVPLVLAVSVTTWSQAELTQNDWISSFEDFRVCNTCVGHVRMNAICTIPVRTGS